MVHRVLDKALGGDPEIEIVGNAYDGAEAVALVDQCHPHLVLMDLEMPNMTGVEAVRAIRKTRPRLPILMFSSVTRRGAADTLEALDAGANDYVTKPDSACMTAALEDVNQSLLPRIKDLCSSRGLTRKVDARQLQLRKRKPIARQIELVAIAISTGGPAALTQMIPNLPADLPVPVVIVQHMGSEIFTQQLCTRVGEVAKLPLLHAEEGMVLEPGKIYVAPGGRHLELQRASQGLAVHLQDAPPVHACRPAADVLFRCLARELRDRCLAVVMTGIGKDGTVGCKLLKDVGARILIQDEASSTIWGMPGSVAGEALEDEVRPLEQIAASIVDHARFGRLQRSGV